MSLRGPECSYCYTCLINVKPIMIYGQSAQAAATYIPVYTVRYVAVLPGRANNAPE